MTDNFKVIVHTKNVLTTTHVEQTATSNADDSIQDLSTAYKSDNESEKSVLLEQSATSNVTNTTTELTSVPCTSDCPLDMHVSSLYGISVAKHSHFYNIDPAILYNNPYTDGISMATRQLPFYPPYQSSVSKSLINLNTVPYSTHVPQTVYAWSTPPPVSSVTPTEDDIKLHTEIAPAPVYMCYPDAREHKIRKTKKSPWREKVYQSEKDYKKTACDRERSRMRDMNRAFDLLRSKLPISKPNGKKYSKIESLRIAINYINHLQKVLNDNTVEPSNDINVEYMTEYNIRRHCSLYRYENHNSNSSEDVTNKLENLYDTHGTYIDNYIPYSHVKWE